MVCVNIVLVVDGEKKLFSAIRNGENEGVKRNQKILRWNETFLLVVKILDTVLFRDFRVREGRRRVEEEKVKVSAVLKG